MGDKDDWMRNPYMFPGVPSITPIHIKRRSESHNSSRNTSNHTQGSHNYNTGYGGGNQHGGSAGGGPLTGLGGGNLSSNPSIGGSSSGGSGKRPSTTSSLLRPSTASGASSATGAATTPTHISTTFGTSVFLIFTPFVNLLEANSLFFRFYLFDLLSISMATTSNIPTVPSSIQLESPIDPGDINIAIPPFCLVFSRSPERIAQTLTFLVISIACVFVESRAPLPRLWLFPF
jgi:hypothetical protein